MTKKIDDDHSTGVAHLLLLAGVMASASLEVAGMLGGEDEPRIYLPLNGPHVGACAERKLADGRVMTVYPGLFGEFELSISSCADTAHKSDVWVAGRDPVTSALLDWDGNGEMPGGRRMRCG